MVSHLIQNIYHYFWTVKKVGLLILLVCISTLALAQSTVITTPNPELRYETRYATQDLSLKKIDTLLEDFHRYSPLQQWNVPYIASNLGNVPRPLFFDPKMNIGFNTGYQSLDNYFLSVDSVRYYNTKTPFTSAQYVFGAKEESLVEVIHSQNVHPNLNFAIDYKVPVSPGFYDRQKSGVHSFSLSSWYQAPSKKYNLLSAYILNSAKIQENGGLAVNDVFTNPAYAQDATTAPVNLYSAENKLKNHTIFLTQTFYLGPTVTEKDSMNKAVIAPKYGITHHFEYNHRKIEYKDDEDSSRNFFSDFFIYNDSTRDLTKSHSIRNEIYFQNYAAQSEDSVTNAFKYAWKGGIRHSINKYAQNNWSEWRHGIQLFGSIRNSLLKAQKFDYQVDAMVELAPKYSGDFLTRAYIKYQPNDFFFIAPFAEVNMQSPSMKMERFRTNHFQWNNDFNKQLLIQSGAKLGIPKWHINVGLNYYLVHNYLYYGENQLPAQLSEAMQVIRLTAEKNFYLKRFVFKNQANYQMSSHQEVLNQPQFYLKHQWYYRGSFIKKKTLNAQLGFDLTYFGNHFAHAYSPALMEYYVQNEEKLKFYPIVDIFFNLQVKRVRLFLMMQHVNQGLLGDGGYYTHPNSPATPRALRLGVSWQFYD